jgi:hypothetical protein
MNHTVTLARGFDKSVKQPFGAPRRGIEWAIEIAGAHTGMVVVRTYFTSHSPDDAERQMLAEKAVRFVERKMADGYLPWPGVLEYEEDVA